MLKRISHQLRDGVSRVVLFESPSFNLPSETNFFPPPDIIFWTTRNPFPLRTGSIDVFSTRSISAFYLSFASPPPCRLRRGGCMPLRPPPPTPSSVEPFERPPRPLFLLLTTEISPPLPPVLLPVFHRTSGFLSLFSGYSDVPVLFHPIEMSSSPPFLPMTLTGHLSFLAGRNIVFSCSSRTAAHGFCFSLLDYCLSDALIQS